MGVMQIVTEVKTQVSFKKMLNPYIQVFFVFFLVFQLPLKHPEFFVNRQHIARIRLAVWYVSKEVNSVDRKKYCFFEKLLHFFYNSVKILHFYLYNVPIFLFDCF